MGIPKPGEDLWTSMYAEHRALIESRLLRAPAPVPSGRSYASLANDARGAVPGASSSVRAGAEELKGARTETGRRTEPPVHITEADRKVPVKSSCENSIGAATRGSTAGDGSDGGGESQGREGALTGDKAAADEAFRAGLARLEAGDARGALPLFQRAHAICSRTRSAAKALAKVERYIQLVEDSLARGEETTHPARVKGGDAAAADEAYRSGVAALQADPPQRDAALAYLRRAEAVCPPGKRAALQKIRRLIDSLAL